MVASVQMWPANFGHAPQAFSMLKNEALQHGKSPNFLSFFQNKVRAILDLLEFFQNFLDVFWEIWCHFILMWSMSERFLIFDDGNSLFLRYLLITCPLISYHVLKKPLSQMSACELTVLCTDRPSIHKTWGKNDEPCNVDDLIKRMRLKANAWQFKEGNCSSFRLFSERFYWKELYAPAKAICMKLQTPFWPISPCSKIKQMKFRNGLFNRRCQL